LLWLRRDRRVLIFRLLAMPLERLLLRLQLRPICIQPLAPLPELLLRLGQLGLTLATLAFARVLLAIQIAGPGVDRFGLFVQLPFQLGTLGP
jgi:hypothetical protein